MELESINQSETSIVEYPERKVVITRFGIIKLMGDKTKYEIKWETYQKLKHLPAGFTGMVEIKELDLTVPLSQITMMTSGERSETQFKAFVSLPVERVELDIDFKPIVGLERKIIGKYDIYYSALCHYNEIGGKKEFMLDKNSIKELVMMKKDSDYNFCVAGVWHYGQKVL